jgi:hypothetical protein
MRIPVPGFLFLFCFFLCCFLAFLLPVQTAQAASVVSGTVTVQVTPKPVNTFVAAQALGAGVDGLNKGDVGQVYTPANLRAMKSAGLGALTYRLRTELGVEAWHWNPAGTWSERGKTEGYWTSSAQSKLPINVCYGYKLPRRGDSVDQANNDGYSRLDDGDANTFWKSNPYLDTHFTGEDNAKHPQWVLINLGRVHRVNAIQIAWASPYATRYQVQFWNGNSENNDAQSIDDTVDDGAWQAFPQGTISEGRGGVACLRLCAVPKPVRYLRLWMTASLSQAPKPGQDVRDTLGYAIREIGLGTLNSQGKFHDLLRHVPNGKRQTQITVSSTDPWHRASDLDRQVEQPGFDRVFHSGLTRGLPVLMPAGVLYDTPENAVAELRFLRQRGYAVTHMELGEEPDGQYIAPEDYGALYGQWASALHRADPALKLGGPSLQTSLHGWRTWPDAQGNRSWMNRFLASLKRRSHFADYTFFSFEWYPFDQVCAPPAPQLALAPALLADTLARLDADGIGPHFPRLITEYGYSAFAGEDDMDWPGALLDAETPALFLSLGGSRVYFYGYEPDEPIQESTDCRTWGNLTLLLSGRNHHLRQPLAAYYATRLVTQSWMQPNTNQPQSVYRAVFRSSVRISVTAYALRRPNGQWSLLLLNKDPKRTCRVSVPFAAPISSSTPLTLLQYSAKEYRWYPKGANGFAFPDLPPRRRVLDRNTVDLPPFSISVLNFRRKSNY